MARAMAKMEAEQAQSDIAGVAIRARADADAAKNTATGVAQGERVQKIERG